MTVAHDNVERTAPAPKPASEKGKGKEKSKGSKRRRLFYWLLIDLTVAVVILALLLYKPARYNPLSRVLTDANGERVHPYLSHELGPQLYNGAQSQRPFNLLVLDRALNEAIAQFRWPRETGGIVFSAPTVLFRPSRIVLMGTADIEKAEFVITVELEPKLDDERRLNLNVAKIEVGAVPITLLAKMVARRMYQERIETAPVDTEDIRAKIAASLLAGESFEPAFKVDDKWVRLKDFSISDGKLEAEMVPGK